MEQETKPDRSVDKDERRLLQYSFWAGLLISVVLMIASCTSLIRFMYLADSSIDKIISQKGELDEIKASLDAEKKKIGDLERLVTTHDTQLKRTMDDLEAVKKDLRDIQEKKTKDDINSQLNALSARLEKLEQSRPPPSPSVTPGPSPPTGRGPDFSSGQDPTSAILVSRLAAATIAFNSCGLLLGISLAFLGFSLFLLGIKSDMDVTAKDGASASVNITRMSPGALAILCAVLVIWVSLTNTPNLTIGALKSSQPTTTPK